MTPKSVKMELCVVCSEPLCSECEYCQNLMCPMENCPDHLPLKIDTD